MSTPTSVTHFFGESDAAMALAAKLDFHFYQLWFVGPAARAYAFQLNKPKAITIAIAGIPEALDDEGNILTGSTIDVDGVHVTIVELDPAAMIAESKYAGEGIAVKLSNGGICVSPEFWNLPPETRIREGSAEVTETDTILVEELKAFTAEMRQRELEMQTAKVHFEKLQVDEEARLAAEPAMEVVADPVPAESEQLELDFRPV